MYVKRVENDIFDVFWNQGWTDWARFKFTSDLKFKHIGGKTMPPILFIKFKKLIMKWENEEFSHEARQHRLLTETQIKGKIQHAS